MQLCKDSPLLELLLLWVDISLCIPLCFSCLQNFTKRELYLLLHDDNTVLRFYDSSKVCSYAYFPKSI
jgi:hypothetical protein